MALNRFSYKLVKFCQFAEKSEILKYTIELLNSLCTYLDFTEVEVEDSWSYSGSGCVSGRLCEPFWAWPHWQWIPGATLSVALVVSEA